MFSRWASFLGKVLSELAVQGSTSHDIQAFSMNRPAITDPTYEPNFYYGLEPSKL